MTFTLTGTDCRHALRMLARRPGQTATTVLTLAIMIGATTAVFSVVNGVIIRPLPYPNAEELVLVGDLAMRGTINPASFEVLDRTNESFSALSPNVFFPMEFDSEGSPRPVIFKRVAPAFFSTIFRVRPEVGRLFASDDARVNAPPVAMISHAFWQSEFGGDPAVIGQSIRLQNEGTITFEVIGVLAADFRSPSDLGTPPEIFAPFHVSLARSPVGTFPVFGRLKPGVTLENARAEWSVISDQVMGASGTFVVRAESDSSGTSPIFGLAEVYASGERAVIWMFFGAVGAVLLIGVGNLVGLELAALPRFERELAVRAALGWGPGRLMRLMLTRTLIAGTAGGLIGTLGAWAAQGLLVGSLPPNFPRTSDIRMDFRVWAFSMLLAAVAALAVGTIPAWRASRPDVRGLLSASGLQHTGDRYQGVLRDTVTTLQIASGLALTVAAGLLIQTFLAVTALDMGFNPDEVTEIQITPSLSADAGPVDLGVVMERIGAMARVEGAAITTALPGGNQSGGPFGDPDVAAPARTRANYAVVSREFFRVLEIPLVDGRTFTDAETRDDSPVAILSESATREFWSGESPLGKRIVRLDRLGMPSGRERTVVGVVGDTYYNEFNGPSPYVYVPADRNRSGRFSRYVVVRGDSLPRQEIEEVVAALVPRARVELIPMTQRFSYAVTRSGFAAAVLGGFALIALSLAALGIYTVLARSVLGRTRELGLRMALGLPRSRVIAHVLGWVGIPCCFGLGIGLGVAYAFRSVVSNTLYEISVEQTPVYLVAILVVAAVLLAAAAGPAYRASRLDPMDALRDQ